MQPDTDPVDDELTEALLSDSHYERLRLQRVSFFNQPIERKLLYQVGMLGAIAALPIVYALFPAATAEYLPTTSPMTASPNVILLALLGMVIQVGTASMLVAATLYRLRHEPVTEDQAVSILNVEGFASHVGLGTGGLTVVITMAFFALGLAGPDAMAGYIELNGVNPFAATGTGLTVNTVAFAAFAAAVALFFCRQYIAFRLAVMRLERR